MKTVIIAAGNGIRMRPLTLTRPKPLVEFGGKTLIEHIVGALPSEINELVMVIGYRGNQIKNFCGDNFLGRPVTYAWQKRQLGTGHALKTAESFLRSGKFLVLNTDDLFDREGIENCLTHNLCLLVKEHEEPSRFGVVILKEDGSLEEIIEKPKNPPTNLVSSGIFVLDARIFEPEYEAEREVNGEYYLPKMVTKMSRDHKVFVERLNFWYPLATPADIPEAEENLYKFGRGNVAFN